MHSTAKVNSRVWSWLVSRWESRPVAFGAILLLQLAVIFRAWELRDLPFGDTSSYFAEAVKWNERGHFDAQNLVFSPLYVAFLGLAQRVFSDAFAAIIAHRLIILFASAAIVLGVMRAVLPPALAWLMAAWWVLAPANPFFMHHYDVHLFGFAWLALGCALMGGGGSAWWRGSGLAALLVGALFVRNEFLPAVALCGACALAHQVWRWWKSEQSLASMGRQCVALILPAVFSAVVLGLWLTHGTRKPGLSAELAREFDLRHRANFVQVYPYGYAQRRSDWKGDVWHEGGQLLERDFGAPAVTMREAARVNPSAVWDYVRWNLSLIPAGLQLGLFGRHGSEVSPDFLATNGGRRSATWLSLALLAVWGVGVACAAPRRKEFRFRPGHWTWIALICCLPSLFVAITTQRPRPSYILLLLLLLIALTGLAISIVTARRSDSRPVWRVAPAAAGFLLLVSAAWYFSARRPDTPGPRNILDAYHRLAPHRATLRPHLRHFLSNEPFALELVRYLGATDTRELRLAAPQALAGGAPFERVVADHDARVIYLAGSVVDREDFRAWRAGSAAAGWRPLSSSTQPRWELLVRDDAGARPAN